MLFHLNKFIPIAEKIIPKRTSIPILTNICFTDGKIIATDLDTTLVMTVEDKSRFTVPTRIIKSILKSKPKTLKFETLTDNKAKINYDSKSITFNTESVEEFPAIPNGKFKTVAVWSKDVIRNLHDQVPYCSTDEVRMQLNGIWINQNGTIESCATTGQILRLIKDAGSDKKSTLKEEFKGIIPSKAIQILSRFTLKEVKVAVQEDQIKFTIDKDVDLFVKLIEGNFPNYNNVIPKEHSGAVHFDKAEMLSLTAEAKNYANGYTHLSEFNIGSEAISMSVENNEEGTHWQAHLPVSHKSGIDMKIGFDVALLEKVLKGINSKEAVWIYDSPTTASVFTETDECGEEIINLIMPVRLEDNNG